MYAFGTPTRSLCPTFHSILKREFNQVYQMKTLYTHSPTGTCCEGFQQGWPTHSNEESALPSHPLLSLSPVELPNPRLLRLAFDTSSEQSISFVGRSIRGIRSPVHSMSLGACSDQSPPTKKSLRRAGTRNRGCTGDLSL